MADSEAGNTPLPSLLDLIAKVDKHVFILSQAW